VHLLEPSRPEGAVVLSVAVEFIYRAFIRPVLATCGIRLPFEAFENTQSRRSLPIPQRKSTIESIHLLIFTKGGTNTVHGILTFFKRLGGLGLQLLHHRFVTWTKPDTTSLMLGTLTDLARSKSELVAENAFLRQQLIILQRQVKRPACTKTERMLLVLLARIVRSWKQALVIVQEDDAPAVASPGIQALLEIQVQSSIFHTKAIRGDRGIDQGNGGTESPLGS
jgi:hypothetical protein